MAKIHYKNRGFRAPVGQQGLRGKYRNDEHARGGALPNPPLLRGLKKGRKYFQHFGLQNEFFKILRNAYLSSVDSETPMATCLWKGRVGRKAVEKRRRNDDNRF